MPEQRVNLTMKEVVKVAELVKQRDRIDLEIREITGQSAPITESKHPEKAIAAAAAVKEKAAPSAKRQAHARYMGKSRTLTEPLKSQAAEVKKEQGAEAAVAFIESAISANATGAEVRAPWDEPGAPNEVSDLVDV